MTEFGIQINAPLGSGWQNAPLAEFVIESENTLIDFTTERGVGHGVLRVGGDIDVDDPSSDGAYMSQPEPAYLPNATSVVGYNYDVRVYAGMDEIWRGFIAKPTPDAYGNIVGFDALGYRQRLTRDYQHATAGSTTPLMVIRDYRARYAPWLKFGPHEVVEDSQRSVNYQNFSHMNGMQLFDHLSAIGGVGGAAYDIEVWGDEIWARNRRAPEVVLYNPPLDGRNERPDIEWEGMVGRVRVRYTTPIGQSRLTDWYEDPGFFDQYGVLPEVTIPGGMLEDGIAGQVAEAYLERHRRPTQSYRFHRTDGDGLERVDGGITPAHLVRAGEWASLLDQGTFQIVSTSCNVTTGELSFDIGQLLPDWDRLLSQLQIDAGSIRTGINPVTGALEYR